MKKYESTQAIINSIKKIVDGYKKEVSANVHDPATNIAVFRLTKGAESLYNDINTDNDSSPSELEGVIVEAYIKGSTYLCQGKAAQYERSGRASIAHRYIIREGHIDTAQDILGLCIRHNRKEGDIIELGKTLIFASRSK